MKYRIVDENPSTYKAGWEGHLWNSYIFDRSALYTLAHNIQVGAALVMAYCEGCDDARTSYSQRTANFATGLRVAALEEMRVRAAVDRVEQSLGLWGLE